MITNNLIGFVSSPSVNNFTFDIHYLYLKNNFKDLISHKNYYYEDF